MTFEYIDSMNIRKILILGVFIIAVCVVALIPFSNLEGFKEGATETTANSTTPGATTPGSTTPGSTTPGATTPGSTTPGSTTPGATTHGATTPGATTPGATTRSPTTITNNVEFITTVVNIIALPPDNYSDKRSIYQMQGQISKFNTKNSATLLGEMSNPNNLTDSRLFLEYMNWFASHCPLDSDTCTGLC